MVPLASSRGNQSPESSQNQQYESSVSSFDGTRIFYQVSGSGPALVLSDGILCEGFVWKYLRPLLVSQYKVIHWNYRGHGRSARPKNSDHVSIADHARDLWCVLDAAGVQSAVLAGHSMGTQVCLEAYRQHPDRTNGLILVCGSYGRVTHTFHGTDALARLLPAIIDLGARFPRLIRTIVALTPPSLAVLAAKIMREIDPLRTRTEDMLPYFEHLSGMDPELFLRMIQAAGAHSAESILRTIHTPTLVVAGEFDSFTPPRLARQMAEQIEKAELFVVREGSHSCPIEQPDLINQRIATFLQEKAYKT